MGQYLFTDTKRNGQGDRVYTETEKSPCLNASSGGTAGRGNCLFGRSIECGEVYIRKLTPVECERLQTLPDNYTEGIPAAQRYKCLGNGWTVDVITHIFGGIK